MAITFTGTVATNMMYGDSLTNQNMFCIENSLQSRVKVYIRRAYFFDDHLVARTQYSPRAVSYRATNVQGIANTCLYAKGSFQTSQTSDSGVKLYSGLMPSMSGTSGLNATFPGTGMFAGINTRAQTAIGASLSHAINIIPNRAVYQDFVLFPGEAMIAQMITSPISAAVAAQPTDYYFFNAVWQEEPIAVHSINGTVTSGGSGVDGAKVIVLVADDVQLTNAYLWATVTTSAGGTWQVNDIPDGKFAFAYAQNYTGGTYYTAAGAPYVA
jgi:hypothetical protein